MIILMDRSRIAAFAALPALVLGALVVSDHPGFAAQSQSKPQEIGKSVNGRPIFASHLGKNSAPIRIVVLGQMHGNEPAGRRIVNLLSSRELPADVQLWLISTVNPDGSALGTRRNARKVDLNRNFPSGWKTSKKRSPYYAGPKVASEPETRALMAFLASVQPTAVLSFHQAYGMVDNPNPRSSAAAKKLGQMLGLRTGVVPCRGACNGTLTGWLNSELETIGITIEMHANVTPAGARRAASAVIGLGSWLAGTPIPTPKPTPTPTPTPTGSRVPTPTPTPSLTPVPTPDLNTPTPTPNSSSDSGPA